MSNRPCAWAAAGLTALLALSVRAEPVAPLSLGPLVVTAAGHALRLGDDIGTVRSGPACNQVQARAWSELVAERLQTDIRAALAERFAAERSAGPASARVELTPVVDAFRVTVCAPSPASWHGSVEVRIRWTAVSTDGRRLVYRGSTSGRVEQAQLETGSMTAGVRRAVDAAVDKLHGDRRFGALLLAPHEPLVTATR
jgi:hypothetical protein